MPIYAFQCAECGHSFDRLQKMSDADPESCPSCGATGSVRRQLTAPSFRLSGSGWYETDFKKDGDKKRNLVDGGEGASKSTSTTAAAAPAAPAAKTESSAPAPKPAASSSSD